MIHAWMQLSQSEKCEVTTILCVAYSKLRMTYHSEDENIIEMIMFSQRIPDELSWKSEIRSIDRKKKS